MQQLTLLVQQRIKKTRQVVEKRLNSQEIRNLRQQQKIRCEKQSFILSMMRSNKIMSPSLKKSYYQNSFQSMTLLQPLFSFKLSNSIQDDFLNDFVHLYTQFFNYFDNKFSFKTKIKNFLRPTNHNLIVDLIKYFVDFTRDYYVQTLFWKIKNISLQKIQENNLFQQEISNIQQQNQDKSSLKVKPLGSICRNFSNNSQTEEYSSISPRKKTDQGQQRKKSFKNYQLLDVTIVVSPLNLSKQIPAGLQSAKMKINQFFRDQKSRNVSIKQIYQAYIDYYNEKYKKNQSCQLNSYVSEYKQNNYLNMKCQPYKIQLSVQKSGFSILLLEFNNKKIKNSYLTPNYRFSSNMSVSSNKNSPLKTQSSLSPLKINQRLNQGEDVFKNDYFLTSMKVLRVSQNFLPPLITSNNLKQEAGDRQLKYQIQKDEKRLLLPFSLKLKKMADQIEQAVNQKEFINSKSKVLVRSTSYKKQQSENQKKRLQNYANELYRGEYVYTRQSSQSKSKRRDEQDSAYRLSSKKLNIKKKLIGENMRNYQDKKYIGNSIGMRSNIQKNKDSQQKILEWLEKIKNLKQLQRKKIFGMNF